MKRRLCHGPGSQGITAARWKPLDRRTPQDYLRGMQHKAAEFERRYWHLVKEGGKSRFVRREMLGAFVQWSLLAAAFFLFRDHPLSIESIGLADLALLPVFLVWGYFKAGWKWNDMGKKYPG